MRRVSILVAVLALGVAVAIPAGADDADAIGRFDGGKTPNGAIANLERSGADGTVSVYFETKVRGELVELGAPPTDTNWGVGDATTLWWVVFNDPGGCEDGCGEDEVADFFDGVDDRAELGLLYATGSVATSGTWTAAAILHEGDESHLLAGTPLQDADTAEIHVVARSHGPAKNMTTAELTAALTTLEGACDVNTCGDAQFAVFLP